MASRSNAFAVRIHLYVVHGVRGTVRDVEMATSK